MDGVDPHRIRSFVATSLRKIALKQIHWWYIQKLRIKKRKRLKPDAVPTIFPRVLQRYSPSKKRTAIIIAIPSEPVYSQENKTSL